MLYELIQPADDLPSVYREVIDERGYGFHHFGYATPAFDEAVATMRAQGYEPIGSVELPGVRLTYFDTRDTLPGMIELIEASEEVNTSFTAVWKASIGEGVRPLPRLPRRPPARFADRSRPMSRQKPIRRVAIVGTGTIGASWATHYLARGFDVVATDPAPGAETALRLYVEAAWSVAATLGLEGGASPDRLEFTADMREAVGDADFVQENAPELPDVKVALFAEIDDATSSGAIIASSSSGITMSEIQAQCRHPERTVIGHPLNPPHLIPLVEVVGGAATSHRRSWTRSRSMRRLVSGRSTSEGAAGSRRQSRPVRALPRGRLPGRAGRPWRCGCR